MIFHPSLWKVPHFSQSLVEIFERYISVKNVLEKEDIDNIIRIFDFLMKEGAFEKSFWLLNSIKPYLDLFKISLFI